MAKKSNGLEGLASNVKSGLSHGYPLHDCLILELSKIQILKELGT